MTGTADQLHQQGAAAYQAGRIQEALSLFRRASELSPERADIAADLGVALHGAGELNEARIAFERATSLDPNDARFHYNFGLLLKQIGDISEAETEYRSAVQLDPDMAMAHNNLANLLKDQGRMDESIASYESALEVDDSYAPAHRNLADALETCGNWHPARTGYLRSAELSGDIGSKFRAATVMPVIPRNVEEIRFVRERMMEESTALSRERTEIVDPLTEIGATNFLLAYHALDDRPLMETTATFHRQACPGLVWSAPHIERSGASDRIRIGFFSAFFRDHTIGRLYGGLIAGLPRDRFEVVVYTSAHDLGEEGARIRQAADRFAQLPVELSAAREIVARDELDILYFADIGMEPFGYFLAHARLARVQCVGWGHPDTTGLPSIDAFISSELMEPVSASAHYTENLLTIASIPTCLAPIDTQARGDDFGLQGRVYFCPQSLFKLHPDFDPLLGKILAADPQGTVVLMEGNQPQWTDLLSERLGRTIPEVADRVRFRPRLNRVDFLGLLRRADVVLDTIHYSGGLTTYEALSQGTPVITLPGEFMRGRTSLGYLSYLGLDEFVAEDEDDYVRLATDVAADTGEASLRIMEALPKLHDHGDTIAQFADALERMAFA